MAKTKKDDQKKGGGKGDGKLRRRARRDVRFAYKPEFRAIDRAQAEAKDVFQESQQRVGNVYDALAQELAPLGGQYDAQAAQIMADLGGQIGGLAPMLGMDPNVAALPGAGGEGAAAGNLFATLGAGGQQLLASDRMRSAGYQTSVQRQAAIERATLRRQYLEDHRDLLDDLTNQRLDLRGDIPTAVLQRLDELRQNRRSNRLGERELDIAEEQFNKTFGAEQRQARAGRQLVRNQAEMTYDRTAVRPLRKDIEALLGRRRRVQSNIEGNYAQGYSPSDYAEQAERSERLTRRKKRITGKIKRKRRRIRKIRRSDNL